MSGRGSLSIMAALVAVLGIVAAAHAHSVLDSVTPAAGSTVHGSPQEVKITFSQPIEHAFSSVRVLDKAGKRVDKKNEKAPADPKVLAVPLAPLAPGSYRVIWRALAKDGHVTKGEFSFSVAP